MDNPGIFSLEDEARVDLTHASPHSTPYIPPRLSRLPKSRQKAQTVLQKRTIEAGEVDSTNVEGETAQDAANKDGNDNESTVTPSEPRAKRARRAKVTVSHAASSQKAIDITRE